MDRVKAYLSSYNAASFFKRFFVMLLALVLMNFGIACYYQCGLGTDPFSVFVDGEHSLFGMTYGQVTNINNVFLFAFMLVFARKYIHVGSVVGALVSGTLIDLFNLLISTCFPCKNLAGQAAMLAVGLVIFAVAVGLYIIAQLGVSALEAIPLWLSEKTEINLRWLRVAEDVTFMGIGIVLGSIAGRAVFGDIPVLGRILFQNAYITTYIGFAIIGVAIFVFSETRFGMRLSACGENPQAADSLGINVYRTRYVALAISGALGGLGGLIYIVPTVTSFGGDVYGYGFLAMSVLMLGQWKPVRLLFAALLFSLIKTVASGYMSIPFLSDLGLSDNFYKSLPYIITLVILAVSSNKAVGPKACGEPYDKGRR